MADLEVRLLLEAIFDRYHYDFRSYAMASLKRRLAQACDTLRVATLSGLQERVLHEPESFAQLLQYLTVQVSDMFRDPEFFLALRKQVLPVLATYPSIKVWCAGCSTGEEAYSLAILLQEEGLLDRSIIYATDINAQSLRLAASGVYSLDRLRGFTENHRRSGGRSSLSDYYFSSDAGSIMDAALRRKITFSDHSLATDSVFSEVHLITCRNVLIYFDHALQNRALRLFADSLVRSGFLGLGSKESLRFTEAADQFTEVAMPERIYRRKGLAP
jgi:chemotaxis protein methyltransferase CheR